LSAAASLFVDVRANVSGAVAGLKKTEAQLHATGAAAKKVDRQFMATGASTRKAGQSYSMLGASASQAAKDQEKVAPAATKASKATGRFAGAATKAGSSAASMATGMTGAQLGAVGLAYGFGKSVQMAANFDSEMRNVNSIAGLSEGQFKNLKTQVLGLSGPTAQAPETLAQGMYQLVSSGFDANEAVTVLKSSAIAASAGLTDAETATTAIAGAINAYGLQAKDAQKVSDLLFTTVDKGVMSFGDLAQGLGPVLPFATKLGVELDQVGAMLSILTIKGVPAAEAMTYTKGAMAQLVKPTKELKGQFDELGVSSGRELVKNTGSLQGALEALFKSVGGDDQKFAKLFPDIRGLSAAFTVTGQNAGEAKRMLSDFNVEAGRTNRVFDEQKKGQGFVFKQLGVDIKQAGIDIGNAFAPEVKAAGDGLHWFFQKAHGAKVLTTAMKAMVSPISQARTGIQALTKVKPTGGAKVSQTPTYKINVDSKQALSQGIGPVKKGLASIPGVTTAKVRVTVDGHKMRETRTELDKLGRPRRIVVKRDLQGNADTKVYQPKPINVKVNKPKIPAPDWSAVKGATNQVEAHLKSIKPKKAKIGATDNASPTIQSVSSLLSGLDGKTANTYIKVHKTETKGRAGGGRVNESLTEVNERGPESITGGGRTSMLGDGSRQVMALPNGWRVNTAGETRRMFGDIPGLAGGGKVKKKKKVTKDDRAQRRLSRLDYLNETGQLSDKEEAAMLSRVTRVKGKGRVSRDTKQDVGRRRFEMRRTRKSEMADIEAEGRMVGASPTRSAQLAKTMAERHIAEAKRNKDSRALAQAEVELKRATDDLATAQRTAHISFLDAGVALAELTPDLADDKAAWQSVRDFWQNELNTLLTDTIPNEIQGEAIGEAARNIKTATDSISTATGNLEQVTADLAKAATDLARVAGDTKNLQGAVIKKAVGDAINAELGGIFGQRHSTSHGRQRAYAAA
jgi:TP901 family phage tail tape measure protein